MGLPELKPKSLGRLLRLSLTWTAASDVAAGVVFGAGAWPGGGAPFVLMAASLCVYHGGMGLNDWADRAEDARLRPDRPIPSGDVSAPLALALSLALLVAGPLLAWTVDARPAQLLGLVAALATVYDLWGRGPVSGPALLAACRGGNLAAGIVLGRIAAGAQPFASPTLWMLPTLYAAYVFVVSRLGRLEDQADGRALGRWPGTWVACAAGLLLVLPVFPPLALVPSATNGFAGWLARESVRVPLATLVVGAGAFGLLRTAFRRAPWTRPRVLAAMGMALRRLLVFTAGVALLTGRPAGLYVATGILLGYPLSYALRRVFPPS